MRQVCSRLNRFRPAVPLVLRVVLGGLFLWHGIDKFDTGISMIKGMFTTWGVPAPGLTAPLTAVLEIVGGLMLIVGLATRAMSMLLGLVLVGALVYVKKDLGIISSQPMPGAELDLAMLAGLVGLMFQGPGRLSVDDKLGFESAELPTPGREPVLAGR